MSFTLHYNGKPLKFVPINGSWVCVLTDFQADHINMNLIDQDFLDGPIEQLELTVRAQNCLKASGIFTIHQLVAKTDLDLTKIPALGKTTLKDIIAALDRVGLTLKGEEK